MPAAFFTANWDANHKNAALAGANASCRLARLGVDFVQECPKMIDASLYLEG